AEDGIRDIYVTGVQTCALPIFEYKSLEPALTADEGAERESYVLPPVHISRGDVQGELNKGPHRHHGRLYCGGQEQFYLEGQVARSEERRVGKEWRTRWSRYS